MTRYETYQIDNRDSEQMYGYLEARIEAMKRRIAELEIENQKLRWQKESLADQDCELIYLASA
jgi:hypothetical protein